MTHGYAAHYLLVAHNDVLRCGGVVVGDDGQVARIFCLNNLPVEPANVSFVDGWIAPFRADVSGVKPEDLRSFLLEQAEINGAKIEVEMAVNLFQYVANELGGIAIKPLI